MSQSTRDAILALRKDKKAMDVFETPESEEPAASAQPALYYSAVGSGGSGSGSSLGRSDRKKHEDVVQLDLKPSLAFARFAGRIYDSKLTADANNATAAVRVQPLPFARPPSPTAFSSAGSSAASAFESPVDKFNRLKREIAAFQSDLRALAAEDGRGSGSGSGSTDDVGELAALLDRELGKLDQQLTGLASDGATQPLLSVDGPEAADGNDSGGAALVTRLIQRLQQSGSIDSVAPITVSLAAHSTVSTLAADAPLSATAVSSLDRRVAALEQTVGLPVGLITSASARDKSSAASGRPLRTSLSAASLPAHSSPASASASSPAVHLSYSSGFPDLYTAVMSLHRKLGLLDASRMDSLRAHIKSITQDMELIAPAAGGAAAATPASTALAASSEYYSSSSASAVNVRSSGRVAELYELMTRWDGWVGQLPVIVSRLQSLKATHDELRGLTDRVRRIEADSAAADRLLRDDREALQRVSGAATASLEQMSGNLLSMQQRMAALQARVDAINRR